MTLQVKVLTRKAYEDDDDASACRFATVRELHGSHGGNHNAAAVQQAPSTGTAASSTGVSVFAVGAIVVGAVFVGLLAGVIVTHTIARRKPVSNDRVETVSEI